MEATICSPQNSRSYQRTPKCVKAGVSVQALLVAIRCKVTEPVQFKVEAREYFEHHYGVEVSAGQSWYKARSVGSAALKSTQVCW